MSYLINSVDGEDEGLVGKHEVDVVLIHHAPDIVEPARHALDGLLEQSSPARTVFDKGALRIPVELVKEGVDLALLGAEVEDGDAGIAPLHLGGASQHLLAPSSRRRFLEGESLPRRAREVDALEVEVAEFNDLALYRRGHVALKEHRAGLGGSVL